MRWALPILYILLLAGCLSQSENMRSWEGKHRDDLVQRWGPPNQETTLSKGGTSLVYIQTWADQYGAYTCRRVFNTDKEGIVRSWSYYGC